jgi:hypothetical protein
LDFYQKELYHKEKEIIEIFKKEIKLLAPYLKDKKNFGKEKRNILKVVILDLFEQIEHVEGSMQLDEELSQIYEQVKGTSLQEEEAAEFASFKKQMEDLFSKEGNSVDLSSIEMEGTQEEILFKIFQSLENQEAFNKDEPSFQSSAKSKKQIEKEQKAVEKEALQKKAIGTIYKQLAKAFHPDLEQDPILKLQKQALMKKLTTAYEEGDLHTILHLEMEQMNLSESQKKTYTDEHLKTFNQILESQIAMLEEELEKIPLRPQYEVLLDYKQYFWLEGDSALMQVRKTFQQSLKRNRQTLEKLQSDQAVSMIHALIREVEREF